MLNRDAGWFLICPSPQVWSSQLSEQQLMPVKGLMVVGRRKQPNREGCVVCVDVSGQTGALSAVLSWYYRRPGDAG